MYTYQKLQNFLCIFCALCLCTGLSSPPVRAGETEYPKSPAQKAAAIIVDEESGIIRFVIKGQEMALIDETGLHVRRDIGYGGALTDYDAAGFARRAIQTQTQGHKK